MEYAIAENRMFSTHDIFWRSCGHGIQSEDRGFLLKKKFSVVIAEARSMWGRRTRALIGIGIYGCVEIYLGYGFTINLWVTLEVR